MPSFASRFFALAQLRSPLCVGIDPSAALLREWGLPVDATGVRAFCDRVLDAAAGRVAVFKPQSAFFEQFGPDGLAELVRLGRGVREQGALLLIDCKRGDIGHTLSATAVCATARRPADLVFVQLGLSRGLEAPRETSAEACAEAARRFRRLIGLGPRTRSLSTSTKASSLVLSCP